MPGVAPVVGLDEGHPAVDGVAERDPVLVVVGPEVHGVVEDALGVVAVGLLKRKGPLKHPSLPQLSNVLSSVTSFHVTPPSTVLKNLVRK